MRESKGSRQVCCELFVDIDDDDCEDISGLMVTNKSIERLWCRALLEDDLSKIFCSCQRFVCCKRETRLIE
jgi:hypothetical protein